MCQRSIVQSLIVIPQYLFLYIFIKPKAHIARFTSTSEYDDYVDTPKNITTIKTFVRGIYEQKNYRKVIQVSAFKHKQIKCIKTLTEKVVILLLYCSNIEELEHKSVKSIL